MCKKADLRNRIAELEAENRRLREPKTIWYYLPEPNRCPRCGAVGIGYGHFCTGWWPTITSSTSALVAEAEALEMVGNQ